MITFSPAPDPAERPTRFPTPFDRGTVHPLARRAAADLIDALERQFASHWHLHEPGNGKMFGVLVVESPDGKLGYLRGFSGMIDGRWDIDGWVPPAFDSAARDRVWIPGEVEMLDFAAQRAALLAAMPQDALGADTLSADTLSADARRTAAAVRTLDETRTARSRTLMAQIQDSYRFANARGDVRALRDLFAPAEPPAGAGDCAAPKLMAHAYRLGLTPLALAEFWWGASSATGDRRQGVFYAACRGKCLPILTHMLDGLPADPPPLFGSAAIDAAEPIAVYEDEHLLVVNKPSGLLTVQGRSASLQDCVVSRLRVRYPDATGPLVVHRLDLDTSGLLLVAKSSRSPRRCNASSHSGKSKSITSPGSMAMLRAIMGISRCHCAWMWTIGRATSSIRYTANPRTPNGACWHASVDARASS